MKVCRFAQALLPAVLVFSTLASAAPLPGPIDCNGTPFGRRLPVGLDQEYVVVHSSATGSTAIQSFVIDDPNVGFGGLVGVGNVGTTLAVPASIQVAHVDLDGDGRDEWAVAGIKPGFPKVLVVTTFRYDVAQAALVSQGPAWEYALAGNIADLRIVAADVTGRDTNTRQELAVAVRDASPKVSVFVLTGAQGDPNIQQASNSTIGGGYWTMPVADPAVANLRMTAGDVLLEGRDQIVLMATATNTTTRVYYVLRYDDLTADHLSHTRFSEGRPTGGPLVFDIKAADFGGSPAAELLVHDEGYSNDSPETLKQDIRYFTTTRDINNAITGIAIHSAPSTNTVDSQGRQVAIAVGQLDRRPGAEIVVARQQPSNTGNDLLVDLYRVAFDVQGNPAGVVAYGSPQRDDVMFKSSIDLIDATIRDRFGTGVGEVVVAALDQTAQNDATPVLKVNTYAMAMPAASDVVDPTTFARTSATSWPTLASASDLAVHVDRIDFDGDSVLADLGTTCQRVREPMVRTVVHLPPYWDRLQGPGAANGWSNGFAASIGEATTVGTSDTHKYTTSTSHDVSGYIGATVGGDFLGIGVEASVKATAGYTYESARGESAGVDNSVSVSQSQNQTIGEGLVVVESDLFECYSYDVHVGAVHDPGSNIRSCEAILKSGNDDLRSFSPSDLVTWDTVTASGNGQGQPAQWIPLQPDWASVALFHAPTANFVPLLGSSLAAATDGRFGTLVQSPAMVRPHIDIDIGRARPLTNIRVFPPGGSPGDLDGFYVYVSTQPFSGDAPPSGPNVRVYAPDAKTGNGFDHWNIWLRDLQSQAPRVGRYVRLQSPGTEVRTLRLSEIQVFADTHIEPPGYPQAVCDPTRGDGLFTALMYDNGTSSYRKVDVRGQLLWIGMKFPDANCGTDFADTDAQHKDGVQHDDIWSTFTVNGSGYTTWDLTQTTTNLVGSNTSISHSSRVGAELDVEAGAVVKANIGGAYEFSTGVTRENETTMSWGTELVYSGAVGGFQQPANDNTFDLLQCEYRTHPFAYTTSEHSNVGYEQQFTVVDYVVRDLTWSRQANPPPPGCYTTPPDTLFQSGFE